MNEEKPYLFNTHDWPIQKSGKRFENRNIGKNEWQVYGDALLHVCSCTDKSIADTLNDRETFDAKYNPEYGDDRVCICGHVYYRHFDSYEDMAPVGCKYCGCYEFVEGNKKARTCSICDVQEGHIENSRVISLMEYRERLLCNFCLEMESECDINCYDLQD